ncbi:MAG TPA: M4 family metallopeptidase [candidate division Zixibacteria bacterium]|nr:M4 family metallopeptidase [candidate division Zixibacteria bacterium]
MKSLLVAVCLAAMLFSTTGAANSEETVFGPNLLRNDPTISIYRESGSGVATFVSGHLSSNKSTGNEVEAALEFLEANQGAFRIESPRENLLVKRVDKDDLGMVHVRFDQYYQGIRILEGELLAHFSADGLLQTVNGNVETELDLSITPDIDAATAVAVAERELMDHFGKGEPNKPELVVFRWQDEIYLCWRMFLWSSTPMGRWEYLVDAHTGDIRFLANRIMDANDIGTGVGVMGDPRYHIDTDYNGSVYEMNDYTRRLNNNPHGHDGEMPAGAYIRTYLATSSLPGSVATDADNYWSGTTYAPAVDGQVYTGLVYDYLLHHLGRNGFDDAGSSMRTSVNYSAEGDNNAYWNGDQIVIWSYSGSYRSLAGCPDVIAHEWGHAVTENCSDLAYQLESGALNEAFSDMIGTAFEFAHDTLDTPDWLIGENGTLDGSGFRDMSAPHNAGDPDYYGTSDPYWIDVENCSPSYFNDYCGVHTNCGVGNKWFYLYSDGGSHHSVTVTGIGVQNAIQVAYRANRYYWTSSTDYHEGALGTLQAAADLDATGTWQAQAALAWNAVGVETPMPGLQFTWSEGVPETVSPGEDTDFYVTIAGEYGGQLVVASPTLFYSVDGGAYSSTSMMEMLNGNYLGTLPSVDCGSSIDFYIRAREQDNGYYYDPDPSTPYHAVPVTSMTVLFEDDFETNKGWTVSGSVDDGAWNRGVPVGGGDRGDPPTDYDGSGSCYLTDNVDDNSDVDNGTTILTSPVIDCSLGDAQVSYARWFSNDYGSSPNEDTMHVFVSNDNGSNWILVENVGPVDEASGGWYTHSFLLSDFVTPTSQVKVRFTAEDLGDGSVVEAGVDAFSVVHMECVSGNAPQIQTTTLPEWTQGVAYSQQLTAIGGTGNLTWTDLNGDLVGTGLSLTGTGLVTGTPTVSGDITFTAEVTDETPASDTQVLTITVNPVISVTTTTLPDWTAGIAFSQQLAAVGGTGTLSWLDELGDLSGTGLSLSSSGLLSGTPTTSGTIDFTARVNDAIGGTQLQELSLLVNDAVAVLTTSLPDGVEGDAYSQQLNADGGTGTIAWTDAGGDLAGTGLTLSTAGLVTGTVASATTITFTAQAEDALGSYDTRTLSILFTQAWICGDADGNGSATPDIQDLVYLVAYMFNDGPPPPVMATVDVDGSGSGPDISDLIYLVSYMFQGGPELQCP